MGRKIWKNLLTFVLVLALTVGAVATLSMATAAKTETAPARYSQQVRESKAVSASELSAAIPEEAPSSAVGIGMFALILAIPGVGVYLFLRSRRMGNEPAPQPEKRYSLRDDMAFQNVNFVK